MIGSEERQSQHELVRNLWPPEIEACDCADTLTNWYLGCISFGDDLIAQLDADKVSGLRDEGWRAAVTKRLIGAKKNARLIERVAARKGFALPESRDARRVEKVARLEAQVLEAGYFERKRIAEWLTAVHGARGAEIAEELLAREHILWRREQREVAE